MSQVSSDVLGLLVTITFWFKKDLEKCRVKSTEGHLCWPDQISPGDPRFASHDTDQWAPSAGQKRAGRNGNDAEAFDGKTGLVSLLTADNHKVPEGPWTVFQLLGQGGKSSHKTRGYGRLHKTP
jgi:hypothetical protein